MSEQAPHQPPHQPPQQAGGIAEQLAGLLPHQRAALEDALRRRRDARAGSPPVPAVPVPGPADRSGGTVPLSSAQSRIWFLERFVPDVPLHVMAGVVRVAHPLDAAFLARALQVVVDRHEVLRTAVGMREGRPVGRPQDDAPVEVRELPLVGAEEREEYYRAVVAEPFDLASPPALRVVAAPLDAASHEVLVCLHHLVSDGFSTGVLLGELGRLLQAHQAGVTDLAGVLPPLPYQFADHAEQEHRTDRAASLAFWRDHLAGAPARLTLGEDHRRPVVATYRGERVPFALDAAETRAVRDLAARLGITPFAVLLTAYAAVLHRYAMQDDLVLAVPVAGRGRSGSEQLVGPFLNTVCVRSLERPGESFAAVARDLSATWLACAAHGDVPFDLVVAELAPDRDPARSPVAQAGFNFQTSRTGALGPVVMRDLHNGTAQLDLLLALVDGGETIDGHLDLALDAFKPRTVHGLLCSLRSVLAAAAADPARPLTTSALLGPQAPPARLLGPSGRDVPEPVAVQVARTIAAHPDRVAVVAGPQRLTYRQLGARVRAIGAAVATALEAAGRTGPARIGVLAGRDADLVAAELAVLGSEHAFVALDPAYPADRLRAVAADSDLALVLTDRPGAAAWAVERGVPVLDLGDVFDLVEVRPWAAGPSAWPVVDPDLHDCAYVVLTSGSSGRPKGVEVSHRNLATLLAAAAARPGLGPDDVLLAVTSSSFDISVLELLLPLVVGGTVVVAGADDVHDPGRLARLVEDHDVSCLQATPATWRMLVDDRWPGRAGLRAWCGGEVLPTALAADLLPRVEELWNLYGPSETTIWSSAHRVTAADAAAPAVPLGTPLAGTTIEVRDRVGTLVPRGMPGELWIGGDGVALGYLGQPRLTARRFVDLPLGAGRAYRTGDLARIDHAGRLQFLGRLDQQVKVRGFRVEPGELEVVADRVLGVGHAVASALPGPGGTTVLVLHVEPEQDVADPPEDGRVDGREAGPEDGLEGRVRSALRAHLPEYMWPAHVVVGPLPLTPSGKVDRQRLAVPAALAADRHDPAAPASPTERELAALWSELLEVEQVGADDDFFALGGHSLLATRLVFAVRTVFGVDLPLQTLFAGQATLAGLARVVDGLRTGTVPADGAGFDLAAEARLPDDVRPAEGLHVHTGEDPQNVLLTGATGFVGAFLLRELLDRTGATVFCLVRGASRAVGRHRLVRVLDDYGLLPDAREAPAARARDLERLVAVPGDLARPRLGLSRAEWDHLARTVDVVHHCGATVNFLHGYEMLRAANVLGTLEVLRLACTATVKPVHLASTTYVFSRFDYEDGHEFAEDDHPLHRVENTFGYTQSKWVAEQLALEAGRRGLPVSVYRMGRVAGHSVTGACQTYDFVWQAMKVAIQTRTIPTMSMTVDITPVDYVVSAVAHLAQQPRLAGRTFHLVSPDPVTHTELVRQVVGFGYGGGREVTFAQWCEHVQQVASLSGTTAGALAPFLTGTLPLDRIPSATFRTDHVQDGLRGSGISCPPTDERLLRTYLDHFVATGYLPAPERAEALDAVP